MAVEKYPNIIDNTGKEWTNAEIVDLYKKETVAPLIRELYNKVDTELKEFENTTGIYVVLSPVLVWDQAYQAGCELILKSHRPLEEICSLA